MTALPTAETPAQTDERAVPTQLWGRGVLAGALAASANLVVYVLGRGLFAITFLVPPQPGVSELQPLPVVMIVVASVLPALAATVLLWLLGRLVSRPRRLFQVVALVLLLLSLGAPLSLPTDVATRVGLALMHGVAAVAIVGVLTVWRRDV